MEGCKQLKKLYSVLGTGKYELGRYHLQHYQSQDTRFAPLAILDILSAKGIEIDEVVVFSTKEAYETNGDLLYDELKAKNLTLSVRFVSVVEKLTQETIWEFFSQIYDEITEGEQVYFDITHGFRSFPMAVIPILYYARELKEIQIGGLFYGNYEARVQEENIFRAPLDDLTDLLSFLDWTQGIISFLESGDASRMIKLTAKGSDISEGGISNIASENLARSMQRFSSDLSTCRGRTFPQHAKELQKSISHARKSPEDYQEPLVGLLDKVANKLAPFEGDAIMDGFYAVIWSIEHKLIQQACTMLYEHVITTICFLVDVDPNSSFPRKAVIRGIYVVNWNIPESRWHYNSDKQRNIIADTVHILKRFRYLDKHLRDLSKLRNSMSHAEATDRTLITPIEFTRDVERLAMELKPFFEEASGILLFR